MAKAQITMPDGIVIKIDGTPEEVSAVLREMKKQPPPEREKLQRGAGGRKKHSRILIGDLLDSLNDGGFFKKPRGLAEVKTALAEMGHHYPLTTLSGAMLKEVRKRNLRRMREEKHWVYAR